ncbi:MULTISPECIES: nickel ABC transporter ATP-binding protein NikE [Bradyrhizobium]|jgi:peptide/nickel transport system ATP-binding protein|uniref:nickel ABC transporter ATP-binding protein NikE n=1 Tax=Bradyrhizobium TaxID=374 RepID=UPI000558AA44|nr:MULTISPECIES: ABC transporter ATP-binding protein [Bradyrhizobium]MDI2054719.1 ABC transporter ATP-binding protein [Bradyrhizobium sp. Mp19]MDI2104567.1 ABC transporter ATP-binding protein [Bradyrhizobium sp. Mp64]WLA97709.1 ABC transporter ATP-binding protein [Bradyrhizobium elkanii]WLC10619.1 ABC transporter ATP-binding protein [Bradyrhizobium elkanii USDA 94]
MSGSQPNAPLVDVQRLSVGFAGASGGRSIVVDVDLTIRPGECVALVGESGSGKSVTARSLLNLAGEGAIARAQRFEIKGRDVRGFSEADWRKLRGTVTGLVMQDALVSLDPLRTIGQEVAEVISSHGILTDPGAIRERTLDTLRKVGIPNPADRVFQYAHQLSGGLRQRALIASAIAADPDLIIADEPTTSLDVTVQAQVLQVLAERIREGAGLLLISHDLAVVAGIADRVVVMRDGRIVDSGPTREVLARPRHAYTRQLIAAVPSLRSRGARLASARFELAATGAGDGGAVNIVREPLPSRRAVGDVVLEVEKISKSFTSPKASGRGRTVVLQDISFDVRAGEVVGIVGESGSGKSTCAKVILGLLPPDEGEVRLLGGPWSAVSEAGRRPLRRKLQYIPQDALSSFDPRYRVQDIIGENLVDGPGRNARRERIVSLLELVGLGAAYLDRRPRSLSGGQRQRVSIARALAAEPALIVCDEPVSALDICIQAQVLDLLAELQSRLGTALIFISHDLGVIEHLADRVLVFHNGRMVEQGSVEAVLRHPQQAYTQSLLASVPDIQRGLTTRLQAQGPIAPSLG